MAGEVVPVPETVPETVPDKNGEPEEFSLEVKELPIRIRDKNGATKDYILREIAGDERDRYQNMLAGKMKFGPEGKPAGLRSFDGIQANLIHRCLFTADTKQQVPEAMITKWPSKTQTAIFKRCQELCGLDNEAEEKAKND